MTICCVVPTIRQSHMEEFRKAWARLFEKHNVTLITVWDGDEPLIERNYVKFKIDEFPIKWSVHANKDLFCRKTDAIRNAGFVFAAATADFDFILTLDDDVHPPAGSDPIQEHLDVLQRRVPISWMNTAMEESETWYKDDNNVMTRARYRGDWNTNPHYLRGFPYGIRDEAPVMVSHGVWVNVPDFDGRTQLELTNNGRNPERLPYSLPYFRGPVPKGCYLNFCGMNVMVRKEALPYLYFAPMGPDSGVEGLNRFADIWCGIILKQVCDRNGWAIYTGASTVIHTRASDPFKNVEQEKLGIEWNEWAWQWYHSNPPTEATDSFKAYWRSYLNKAARFRDLIRNLQGTSEQ